MEHEADVRPGRGELSPVRALFAPIWCICEGRTADNPLHVLVLGIFSFAIHYSLNGQIYVDG